MCILCLVYLFYLSPIAVFYPTQVSPDESGSSLEQRTMPAVSEDDRGRVFTAVIGVVALCVQRVRSSPSPEGS